MTIRNDNSYGPNSAAYFQKHLGKGGFVPFNPRQTEDSQSSSEESDRIVEEAKAFGQRLFSEASPVTLGAGESLSELREKHSQPEKAEESMQYFTRQIGIEAWEQWHGRRHPSTLYEYCLAALLSFSCADALGATTEFMSPAEITQTYGVHKDIIGEGWLELEAGEVTDDTEMMLCVARSLDECKGYDLRDIAAKFVDWYNSDPVDIGSTCRHGIHRYIRTGKLEAAYNEHGAGNGGVMRALPLILAFANDRDRMMQVVVEQSRLTHNNKESDEGCRCYADMVAHALTGASKDMLRNVMAQYPIFAAERYNGKSSGYIVDTLRTVFHFFFQTNSLEDCIVEVVNRGEDADTCGALAGGLAGCHYGLDGIPPRWLATLDRRVHDELVGLSGVLYG